MTIGGRVVRGRMDAVFGDGDDGWLVVDWKTGRRPSGAAARAAAVQLAAYRLAWARLRGIPDADVCTGSGPPSTTCAATRRSSRPPCSTPTACARSSPGDA